MLLGYTPTEHAASYGGLPALRFLLDHGADLHQMRKGVTFLHVAVEKGKIETKIFHLCLHNIHRLDYCFSAIQFLLLNPLVFYYEKYFALLFSATK
jgi:ankyrin repeat protein